LRFVTVVSFNFNKSSQNTRVLIHSLRQQHFAAMFKQLEQRFIRAMGTPL